MRDLPRLVTLALVLHACGESASSASEPPDGAAPDAAVTPPDAVTPDAEPPPPPDDAATPDASATPDAASPPPDMAAPPEEPPELIAAAAAVEAAARPFWESGWMPSLSIALVSGEHVRFINGGQQSAARPEPPTEDSLYAIGSVSKTFTGLMLADAVERGEVALEAPLRDLLPAGATAPEFEGTPIRLQHLTTHTSALPRDAIEADGPLENWYRGYTVEMLWDWLSGVTLSRAPGAEIEYSNAAVGVLGQTLAFLGGVSYEARLAERVTGPLGLTDTVLPLDPDRASKFVPGRYNEAEVEYWDLGAAGPAGAIVSSTRELARYLQAQVGVIDTPLDAAIERSQTPLFEISPGRHVAYNWFTQDEPHYLFHDGAVPGHSTFVIFQPDTDQAVVVLSAAWTYAIYPLGNYATAALAGVDVPIPEPPPEIEADPATFDQYVGRYNLGFGSNGFTVSRQEDLLLFRVDDQPDLVLYAEGPDAFHLRVVQARITFERAEDGTVRRCTLHQNGQEITGSRLGGGR